MVTQTGIPDAAVAVIAAALEDYRTITPPAEATPAGAAAQAAAYLLGSGFTIHPLGTPPPPLERSAP